MAYPTDLPLIEIQSVIGIVRAGEIKDKFKDLAHDVWIIQGYAQGMLIGKPDTGFALAAQADFDAIDTLEKLVASEDTELSAQAAIPWDMLLAWALDLLRELFEKYFGGGGE